MEWARNEMAYGERAPFRMGGQLYGQWRAYIEFYHAHSIKLFAFMLAKSILIVTLNNPRLEQLQWLDCWIPGRLHYGTRITQAARYLAILSWIILLANRMLLDKIGLPFSKFCLELACVNYQHMKSVMNRWPYLSKFRALKAHEYDVLAVQSHSWCDRHPVLCEFFLSPLDGRQLIKRPTQTVQMRRIYGRLHLLGLSFFMMGIMSTLAGCIMIHVPILVTRRGFELSRENCVHFILRRCVALSVLGIDCTDDYKSVYEPSEMNLSSIYQRKNPILLPYVELVPMNWYHITRILLDVLENLLCWPTLVTVYWYTLYYTVIFSYEVLTYSRDLRHRLGILANELRLINDDGKHNKDVPPKVDSSSPQLTDSAAAADRSHMGTSSRERAAQLGVVEIMRIQASILDYFSLVKFYNPFVALTTFINLLLWLVYTFFIFVRAIKIDRFSNVNSLDHGIQTEFFLIFFACLTMALVFLIAGSLVDSESRQLYTPITRMMALDRSSLSTRKRWPSLLNYFKPKKLHCFTILNQTTLSWLFVLKLLWWVISALVILISI